MSADEHFMRLAIEIGSAGVARGQTPFGACVVRDGQVLSREHNSVFGSRDSTAHAEVRAIRSACAVLATHDLAGCVVYTTCEPCPMCFGACHWAHVRRIVYGTTIADAAALGFGELTIAAREMKRLGGSPVEVVGGVLREESLELFRKWTRGGGGQVY